MSLDSQPVELIEPTFATAIDAINSCGDLTPAKRRHWICSLRQISKALGRPLSMVPARWMAIRHQIASLHHGRLGISPKTLSNHIANTKAALTWFTGEHELCRRGVRLCSEWELLAKRITSVKARRLLSSPMRYWSSRGVGVHSVNEAMLDDYMRYRASATRLSTSAAARRAVARAWNACTEAVEGWPQLKLVEPAVKPRHSGPDCAELPEGLRKEIQEHLDWLRSPRKSPDGRKRRPCKSSTIETRRSMLVAYARRANSIGFPIERLTSLAALLHPDIAETVLGSYWPPDEEKPKVYAIDLAARVYGLARNLPAIGPAALERLAEIRDSFEQERTSDLTEKNLKLIRDVLTPGVWRGVCLLPEKLMAEARGCRERSPTKAAVKAQLACAIVILTRAPIRLANLTAIRIGDNLSQPGGPGKPYLLTFPEHDVKNRIRLEFPLDEHVSSIISEYIYDFLPTLIRGAKVALLFPGNPRIDRTSQMKQGVRRGDGSKGKATLSAQITERIQRETGLRITVHQFRHAAAALILMRKPGSYEFVRRLLGHKNVKTTISFYVGLQTTQAAEEFGTLIGKLITGSQGG